jgi:hypothetical protein
MRHRRPRVSAMTLVATAALSFAAANAPIPALAGTDETERALQDLRDWIGSSEAAERDYAIALEVWRREQAAKAESQRPPDLQH